MQRSRNIFLVLVYLFYLDKCRTTLPPKRIELRGMLFPDNLYDYDVDDLFSDVIFQLYTRSEPTKYTVLKTVKDTDVGDFNSGRETKIIIHGWRASGDYLAHIRKGYLETGDYNVIVVDWSKRVSGLYTLAVINVKLIGDYLASLIDILVMYHGLRPEDVHIIGHSLGGQMAGIAGNSTKSGKPGRITALDPAAPGYCDLCPEHRLDSTDAQFVDVIHTCGGVLGWKTPIGHADFYPNDGIAVQPGCDSESVDYEEYNSIFPPEISCSHARALEYFAESITTVSGFASYECPSWDDFTQGNCFQNPSTLMGEHSDTRGSYYLQTAKSSPYALGDIATVVDTDSDQKKLELSKQFC